MYDVFIQSFSYNRNGSYHNSYCFVALKSHSIIIELLISNYNIFYEDKFMKTNTVH